MLIHTLNSCDAEERSRIQKILAKPRDVKTETDVEYVRGLMQKYEAIEYAVKIAKQFASKARSVLLNECDWMVEKKWKDFFLEQTNYLVQRKK